MQLSFPTEQAKAYGEKVKEMKKEGKKPSKRAKKILDPDVQDDCGEDLGELGALDETNEVVCWNEAPNNLVEDYMLEESEYNVTDYTRWPWSLALPGNQGISESDARTRLETTRRSLCGCG